MVGEVGNKVSQFLQTSSYAFAVGAAVIGVIVWTVRQQVRIEELQQGHLEMHHQIDEIDVRGTRALSDRVNLLSAQVNSLDQRELAQTKTILERMTAHDASAIERLTAITNRDNSMEAEVRKIGVIEARQIEVMRRLDAIERRLIDGRMSPYQSPPQDR